jgi:hypothetical protein
VKTVGQPPEPNVGAPVLDPTVYPQRRKNRRSGPGRRTPQCVRERTRERPPRHEDFALSCLLSESNEPHSAVAPILRRPHRKGSSWIASIVPRPAVRYSIVPGKRMSLATRACASPRRSTQAQACKAWYRDRTARAPHFIRCSHRPASRPVALRHRSLLRRPHLLHFWRALRPHRTAPGNSADLIQRWLATRPHPTGQAQSSTSSRGSPTPRHLSKCRRSAALRV